MRDGFRSATQCAQCGLLRPLFCNRRLSVRAHPAIKFVIPSSLTYVSVEDDAGHQAKASENRSGLAVAFLSYFRLRARFGPPSPPSDLSEVRWTIIIATSGIHETASIILKMGTSPRSFRQTFANTHYLRSDSKVSTIMHYDSDHLV